MPSWTPQATGADFAWPPLLRPLQSLREELTILSGLALDPARAHGDGGGDHARAMASFLTCQHPRKTNGTDLKAGLSADQIAARAIGRQTRFASLEIGCEGGRVSGVCDHGYSCAYQTHLAWSRENTPLPQEIDPRLLFERLFGTGGAAKNSTEERERRSLLDFVTEDARQLRDKVGSSDKQRIEEYLTGIRELELRITRAQPVAEVGPSRLSRPVGIPGDYGEYLRVMADLLVLAFQTDSTRIATFAFGNDGSNRSYPALKISEGHHDLSHHGGDPAKLSKIQAINVFHLEQLAYLLKKLQATKEGEGTLLDNCMIVYGSGISDGDAHSHDNLPILLAGRGRGTLKTGKHLRCSRETPLANLHRALLDRLGVSVTSFGDSTGSLSEIGTLDP
jgi:hypothetical protein